jgi:hypothetical protein
MSKDKVNVVRCQCGEFFEPDYPGQKYCDYCDKEKPQFPIEEQLAQVPFNDGIRLE